MTLRIDIKLKRFVDELKSGSLDIVVENPDVCVIHTSDHEAIWKYIQSKWSCVIISTSKSTIFYINREFKIVLLKNKIRDLSRVRGVIKVMFESLGCSGEINVRAGRNNGIIIDCTSTSLKTITENYHISVTPHKYYNGVYLGLFGIDYVDPVTGDIGEYLRLIFQCKDVPGHSRCNSLM